MICEKEVNFSSVLKNSADTMIKFVKQYNMQNNEQKDLIHLFQDYDSKKNKISGKNGRPSYGSKDFVLILEKLLDDKQKFYQMVNESQHITYTHKDVYKNELRRYYLKELEKPEGKFFKIAGEENKNKLKKLYHDRIKAEQQQNQNQNLRDCQIDQNNYALEQYTELRNSTTSVESLSIEDDQFASSDQEQGRQNNQASQHNEEWQQEGDQIDFQKKNYDYCYPYEQ